MGAIPDHRPGAPVLLPDGLPDLLRADANRYRTQPDLRPYLDDGRWVARKVPLGHCAAHRYQADAGVSGFGWSRLQRETGAVRSRGVGVFRSDGRLLSLVVREPTLVQRWLP